MKKIYMMIFIFLFLSVWGYGYIDPGTGSYMIQILLAAFVGASLGIKIFWGKIKSFLWRTSDDKKEEK